MKNNQELQSDVQNAIQWNSLLRLAEIGVTVKDGIVSLTGVVDSLSQKLEAENTAKKVIGVKALVENITVQCPSLLTKTNAEMANEVLTALKSNWIIPEDKITVTVQDGWVTLEGELPWKYQKDAAKNEVDDLLGVKGVINNIIIKLEIHDVIEKKDIEEAICKSESMYGSHINVSVTGATVTLKGTVNSWNQKQEAAQITWSIPGIWQLKNELVAAPDYATAD